MPLAYFEIVATAKVAAGQFQMRHAPQDRIVRREIAQNVVNAARSFEGALAVRVEDKRQGPPKLHDLPSLQKLCGSLNPPTAALLLSEYVNLRPGEWVVQNAANSGVGRWVIAFAKTRGLKTVNIVRRPELVAELEAIGGDVVVVEFPDVPDRIKAAVGQAELRLGLDGVSGPATGVLAATLSPHGTLVSFAAMSEGPMSINPLDVIFKPLTMRGFWLGHPEIGAKIGSAIVQAAAMIASGRVHIPVAATYPISSIKQAVAHAQRGGKILLDVAGSST